MAKNPDWKYLGTRVVHGAGYVYVGCYVLYVVAKHLMKLALEITQTPAVLTRALDAISRVEPGEEVELPGVTDDPPGIVSQVAEVLDAATQDQE